MQDRIYLLSIAEFLAGDERERLLKEAFTKVDAGRREKVARIRQPKAKAAGLGAGLLLQLAVKHYEQHGGLGQESAYGENLPVEVDVSPDRCSSLIRYDTIQELLHQIVDPIPLEFTYGNNGKPYFREYPFYFNLSHSGDYVVCAVSNQEIGVDIQEHREGHAERIAKRYFTTGEIKTLDACEPDQRTKMFFELWAAKEAYGKYTGGGIAESLESEIPADRVVMQLIHSIPGYSLAVCKGVE